MMDSFITWAVPVGNKLGIVDLIGLVFVFLWSAYFLISFWRGGYILFKEYKIKTRISVIVSFFLSVFLIASFFLSSPSVIRSLFENGYISSDTFNKCYPMVYGKNLEKEEERNRRREWARKLEVEILKEKRRVLEFSN